MIINKKSRIKKMQTFFLRNKSLKKIFNKHYYLMKEQILFQKLQFKTILLMTLLEMVMSF